MSCSWDTEQFLAMMSQCDATADGAAGVVTWVPRLGYRLEATRTVSRVRVCNQRALLVSCPGYSIVYRAFL